MNNEYHSFASFPERLQCLLQETFIQRVRFSFLSASLTKKFSMLSLSLSLSLSVWEASGIYHTTVQLWGCSFYASVQHKKILMSNLDRIEVWM
jgi:hypothetical protein